MSLYEDLDISSDDLEEFEASLERRYTQAGPLERVLLFPFDFGSERHWNRENPLEEYTWWKQYSSYKVTPQRTWLVSQLYFEEVSLRLNVPKLCVFCFYSEVLKLKLAFPSYFESN